MYYVLFYSIIKEVTISELFIFSISNLRVFKKYLEEKGKKIKKITITLAGIYESYCFGGISRIITFSNRKRENGM